MDKLDHDLVTSRNDGEGWYPLSVGLLIHLGHLSSGW